MISHIPNRHRYRSCLFHNRRQRWFQRQRLLRRGSGTFRIPEAIRMPHLLGIYREDERNLLLGAVRLIHDKAARKGKVCLDFTETRKIYTQGMLYLYAEVKNLQNLRPNLRFSCIESRNDKVNHVLHQVGMFALCRHSFTVKKQYRDVVYWRSCHGVEVLAESFDKVIDPDNVLNKIPASIDIYGGCVEATKNAHVHAYIEERKLSPVDNENTAWWIFSQIKDGKVSIAICDLGIGIPRTLPKTDRNFFMKILASIASRTDAHLIEGAIDTPSSRTQKGYRGNGLKKIAKIAADDRRASFAIYSGKGYVGTDSGRRQKCNYSRALPGTIVAWNLPLGENDDHD